MEEYTLSVLAVDEKEPKLSTYTNREKAMADAEDLADNRTDVLQHIIVTDSGDNKIFQWYRPAPLPEPDEE